jgi:hypothetical protein
MQVSFFDNIVEKKGKLKKNLRNEENSPVFQTVYVLLIRKK